MIIVGSFNNVSDKIISYDGEEIFIDEAYGIVRNKKDKYLINLPELAPSDELYSFYVQMKKSFKWTEKIFQEKYVPQYITDLVRNDKAMETLTALIMSNKNIYLACFCENERFCHRSILAGILKGLGADVQSLDTDVGNYLKYYDIFKKEIG